MSSRQKTALVTGCSKGGIGDAMAQELHRHGYRVFATIRDEAKGAHLREIGITDLVFMDVTDAEAISRAVNLVKEATGGVLDILVNNAGAAYASSMADVDIAQAKRMFDINYFGVLAVTQAFTPLLVASGNARVVNIGSILGVVHRPFTGVYNSAKAALTIISDTMRVELAPFGIKVIHVVTGGISTNFIASGYAYTFPETSIYEPIREQALPFVNGARIQQAMITPAEEYARAVVANAVKRSPTAEFWYGSETTTVRILSLFFPKWLLDSLYTKMCGFNRLAEIVGLSREKTKDT